MWADSTYAYIDEKLIHTIAVELHFPLENFTCTYGAGLCTKGTEMPGRTRTAAPVVIIEMGYNDDKKLSTGDFAKGMQKQSWFTFLKDQASTVKHVIFTLRPT